jgi:signal transduction histidine kinase
VEELSGPGALRALARGFEGSSMRVEFRVEGPERALPPDAELLLYRALQEALTNAVKHSGASSVRARLVYAARSVRLVVADDGGGPGEAGAGGGFGLRELRKRATALGGALGVAAPPGGGFVVDLELPAGAP